MNKPIIGITPSIAEGTIRMRANYVNSVFAFGAIPVFLPFTADAQRIESYCKDCDGILFSGGGDVDPRCYGETAVNDSVQIDSARDAFEFALFRAYFPTKKPIFGICRGAQFLNVALGGTLYQDIAGHRQTLPGTLATQNVSVVSGTALARLVGSDIRTNSFHHQAIRDVASSLRLCAKAEDGCVEAVEWAKDDNRFLLAVQWHPEYTAETDASSAALFHAFIQATQT